MQPMDWQTVVARRARRDPPDKGGWNAFLTSWVAADILNPVMAGFFNASCDKAMFGWPCDAKIEKFRDDFAKETDPVKQKQIAMDLQTYWATAPTHINVGQWYQPSAIRTSVEGMLVAPAFALWNISKK
jgi:peptide/nickel transport system substrate-binding protein